LRAAGWVAQHEIAIARVVPEDGDFVHETVREILLRETTRERDAEPAL
jgi:hypothetical protein